MQRTESRSLLQPFETRTASRICSRFDMAVIPQRNLFELSGASVLLDVHAALLAHARQFLPPPQGLFNGHRKGFGLRGWHDPSVFVWTHAFGGACLIADDHRKATCLSFQNNHSKA